MKLVKPKIHKKLKINNRSFTTVDELLSYAQEISESTHHFLKDWFSKEDYIKVQTSGSTGAPKQISLQKKQMINSALATGDFFDLKENTTALLCLPTNYIAGKMMLVRALVLGWHLDVFPSNSNPLESIEKEYDFSAMVPLQLENSISNLDKIKTLIVGGGVVSQKLQARIQTTKCAVFATYGMTETITHIAVKQLNKNNLSAVFYEILPQVKIFKDERNCLVIHAPKVSNEYVFTNDVVQLISDTKFEWLGRYDNVINSGGVKLHPEKIEQKLASYIDARFFVTGIADDKLGEKLVLIVEGNSKQITFDKAKLSKFEIPKHIYFVPKFVETETKKIQRNKTLDLIKF